MGKQDYSRFFTACKSCGVIDVLEDAKVSEYCLDLSGFERVIRGVIIPHNQDAVSQLVNFAKDYLVPLYPISKGYNWGLGCKLPVADGCVIVDLAKLNSIKKIDYELGTITIEPGVSLLEVERAVTGKNDLWYLPATGAPPESSVVGNALDRGDALGPNGERFEHCCSLKVVLGTGKCITTGYGGFHQSELSRLSKYGLGPSLHGLFCQSSYGIVIEMTLWLVRKPKMFQPFLSTLANDHQLVECINTLRGLQQEGIIKPSSWAIWNNFKMIASERQYPWSKQKDAPLYPKDLKKTNSRWAKYPWICLGGLYSSSNRHGRADRRTLKNRLRSAVHSLMIFDPLKVFLLRWFNRFFGKYMQVDTRALRG